MVTTKHPLGIWILLVYSQQDGTVFNLSLACKRKVMMQQLTNI